MELKKVNKMKVKENSLTQFVEEYLGKEAEEYDDKLVFVGGYTKIERNE